VAEFSFVPGKFFLHFCHPATPNPFDKYIASLTEVMPYHARWNVRQVLHIRVL